MRARISLGWLLTMVLAGGAVATGFAQNDLNAPQTAVSAQKSATAAPSQAAAASVEPGNAPQAAPQSPTAAPAVPGNAPDKSLSPNGYHSPWYYEVERLTQAGVEEAVVLAYIDSSAGTFNLTADQVIALKTLGASPQVINAMMEHDRQLVSGERPFTAATPPPLPPSVQAALGTSLHTTGPASAQPTSLAMRLPPPNRSIIAPDDEPGAGGTWVWVEPDDVPEQPASAGPVRLPYPVKLNDPIIIFRLPSFALPYW